MKIEVKSQPGIRFSVELTEEERSNIKQDLIENLNHMTDRTINTHTDQFLEEIGKTL